MTAIKMQVWTLALLILPIVTKANMLSQESPPSNKTRYSCQNASRAEMYGCYDTSNMTGKEVTDTINDILNSESRLYESIENSTQNVTKETVLKPILDFECTTKPILESLMFLQGVAENKEIREAAASLVSKVAGHKAEIGFMKNVFMKFRTLNSTRESWGATAEEARYLMKILQIRLREGIQLNKTQQDMLKNLHKSIAELGANFSQTLHKYSGTLLFNKTSLRGVPEGILTSLKQDNTTGNYIVPVNVVYYSVITGSCVVEDTRKQLYEAYSSRGQPGNSKLLEEIAVLSKNVSLTLGYKSYVDFLTEVLMAKSATNVLNFMEELAGKMRPKLLEQNEEYLATKLRKCAMENVTCSRELKMWDRSYLTRAIKRDNYTLDDRLIEEYFPLEVVQKKMLEIFEIVLGLTFKEIQVKSWAKNVTAYQVTDNKTEELMGFFFLDLYPREGKLPHGETFSLQPSCIRPDGSRQLPISALVASFPEPSPSEPSLLSSWSLKTLFHEFGHVLHDICSKTNVSYFSGTKVERDFVEAPSQMLENWLDEPDILKNISCHYKNKTQLSDEVIKTIVESKYVGLATMTMGQVLLAMLDQELYVNGSNDADQLFRDLGERFLNVTIPGTVHFPGTFDHMVGDYAGLYYSYLWSEVYSADMYLSTFKKNGTLNPEVGMRYRKTILEKGGTKDAMELLEDFLGRKPTIDAFLTLKHLDKL